MITSTDKTIANRNSVWLRELRHPYRQLKEVLSRRSELVACSRCGEPACVAWGHQYQRLVCQAEERWAATTADVNTRGVHDRLRLPLLRWRYRM